MKKSNKNIALSDFFILNAKIHVWSVNLNEHFAPGYSPEYDLSVHLLIIGLDKSGYQVISFLISRPKHMLWVLIRSASPRRF